MDLIHSVFTIGSYCTADFVLADMYIRAYSSPFSWMYIDLETALEFMTTGFNGFTDAVQQEDESFVHARFPAGQARICRWTHHDLSKPVIKDSIVRRAERLMSRLSLPTTLLVYYDKTPNSMEYYTALLEPFLKDYHCKAVVIIDSAETKIVYREGSLCIIETNPKDARRLLHYLYTFNIIGIEDSYLVEEPLVVRGAL
jgi:hypothetical protein